MSRIGKKPIKIPEGVEVKVEEGKVSVKGPKGELETAVRPEIKVEASKEKKEVVVFPRGRNSSSAPGKKTGAFWGLTRALIANMVRGVSEEYKKELEISGLGYKASLKGEDLVLEVGFSHPVEIKAAEGVKFSVDKNIVSVSGIDKQKVGEMAARIRKVRPPEPYKGKGIKYAGEYVRRKTGKKAAAAE